MGAVGQLLLASLLVCLPAWAGAGDGQQTDANQTRFLMGVEAIQRGDYEVASDLLERLLADTHSPRVKLELARSLFLARNYPRSRQLFREVLALPDLPWKVAENIRPFLDEIDMATGYVKYSLGWVSDSNPRNFTNNREVMIGGQSLTVVIPQDNRQVSGLRVSVHGYRPLDDTREFSAFFKASYTDFPYRNFDRFSTDFGLAHDVPRLHWLKAKLGLEGTLLDGRVLYRFPYLGALAAMKPTESTRLQAEAKLGWLKVPQMSFLDSQNLFLITKVAYPPSQGLAFGNEFTLEKATARESAYSYSGGSVGGSIVWPAEAWGLRVTLSASIGNRHYEAPDPFFGERRIDKLRNASLDMWRPSWRIMGYRPQFGLAYEETNSNLAYYSFKKLGLNFQLEI
jgi:hypothetical protein